MSVNLQLVQVAVREAIGSSENPTPAQVSVISKMTYLNDARKEIQRMIDRRLKNPDAYGSIMLFHTLTLMQKCLPNASTEFVDFCTSQVQFVVSLKKYEGVGTSLEQQRAGLVRSRATALSKILLDPVGLAEKRRAPPAGIALTEAPPTHSRPVPLPTPPSSPAKQGKSPLTPLVTIGRAPLTPGPTPPTRILPRLGTADKSPTSVFFLKKEDIAAMTFRREGFERVIGDLDDLLKPISSVKRDPEELVKALTCVHHCLYWGSAPLVAHCRAIIDSFNTLRQHSVAQVRGHADAVVHLLDDSSRLQQERQSRASLMPRNLASSQHSKDPDSVEETPYTGSIVVLEPVLDISRNVTKLGTRAVAGGGYSDVWKGEYKTGSGKETVAIKFLRRISKIPPERLEKHLNRELRVWRGLLHHNITPFYGIIVDTNCDVGMVSPYYSNGNTLEYVKSNPNIDPLDMLRGIADGVAYLHVKKIVHGDVKCANVMVDLEGTPKLIDFGLAQVIDEFAEVTGYTTTNLASSLRWSAPELLIGDSPNPSKTDKSDVYAFASTCVEIMTLKCPYHGLRDPSVMNCVIKGQPPERPPLEAKWSPCDELWEFLKTCWRTEPQDRPNIVAVQRKLAEFFNGVAADTKPVKQTQFAR